jgi:TrkA domain protein
MIEHGSGGRKQRMRVEEVDLPGVGRKFTLRTQSGDEIVIVVHHAGPRQMLYYEGGTGDEPAAALDLTDEEARELGAILSGVLFHPELTSAASTRIGEQTIEWVTVPSGRLPGQRLGDLVSGHRDAHVIAVSRGHVLLPNPGPDLRLEAGDTLVLAGRRQAVDALKAHLSR